MAANHLSGLQQWKHTAGAAAIWMLVTLFGYRWGILAPLAI
jgi:hypothetical protein